MKTILYARVSTIGQAENGISIDAQIAKLKKYGTSNGHSNFVEIIDAGVSGKSTKREGYQQMMEMVANKEVKSIIVYSLSRLSRSTIDVINTIEFLNKKGVALISLNENLDSQSSMGKFFISVMASISQLERDQISDRTKMSLQFKKSIGERTGQVPFGFKLQDNRLIPDEYEQETIKLVKNMRDIQGLTYCEIARELKKNGRINKAGKVNWMRNQIVRLYNKS